MYEGLRDNIPKPNILGVFLPLIGRKKKHPVAHELDNKCGTESFKFNMGFALSLMTSNLMYSIFFCL